MRIEDALRFSNIDRSDAEILIAHAVGKTRTWVLGNPGYKCTETEEKSIREYLTRRSVHEPVAYITGTKEFFGRAFTVTPAVLIPRPATEGLVALALDMLRGSDGGSRTIDSGIIAYGSWLKGGKAPELIVDIGTGSGCIAVTLACEMPEMRFIATDISEGALEIARKNAQFHGVDDRIEFSIGDGLDAISDVIEPFFVVSNPPYIADGAVLEPDVRDFEPHTALFSGRDGADMIRGMMEEIRKHPFCTGFCIECSGRHGELLN